MITSHLIFLICPTRKGSTWSMNTFWAALQQQAVPPTLCSLSFRYFYVYVCTSFQEQKPCLSGSPNSRERCVGKLQIWKRMPPLHYAYSLIEEESVKLLLIMEAYEIKFYLRQIYEPISTKSISTNLPTNPLPCIIH